MYRYEYVSLCTGGGFFSNNSQGEHKAIIDQYAADGWRYVGFVPTCFTSHGGMEEVDLVFEKDEP